MSSRNFRRRNNRRKHRQGGEGAERRPEPPQQPGQGSKADAPSPPRRRAGSGGAGPGPGERSSVDPRQAGGPEGRRRHRPRGRREKERQGAPGQQGGREPDPQYEPPVARIAPDCPVCGKPVRELPSALTHRVTGKPAHFECILKELRDANELAPQEKLCYLGGGTFGILQFRPAGSATRFTIRKRISYEEKDTPQDWKKTLTVSC